MVKKGILYPRAGFIIMTFVFSHISILFGQTVSSSTLELKVGLYENRPKIYITESGEIKGIFPELLTYIGEQEQWTIHYIPGTWTECLKRLDNNTIDLMVDVAFSKERAKRFDFTSEPVFINWGTIYVPGESSLQSLVDLRDKKIAVMKSSIHFTGEHGIRTLLATFDIPCTFIEVDNYTQVFELLDLKAADAGVVNRIFGILHNKNYFIKQTPIVFNPVELRFALPKNRKENRFIIDSIDSHLKALKNDNSSLYYRVLDYYLSGLLNEQQVLEKDNKEISINLTENEKKWIKKHPVVRMGIDPEFVPFEYLNEHNEYSGIASDYINLLQKRTGITFTIIPGLKWEDVIEKSKNKEIDLLPCVGITEERKEYLHYSRSYINFHHVIITRIDNPFITGLDDIKDISVAVQMNTSHEGYLKDHTDISPKTYQTLHEALIALSDGKVDAFIGNIASATYWIRKLNLINLKVAAPVSYEPQSLHFAVRKDWPELVHIINKGLASISKEEENIIHKRWVTLEYKPGIDPGTFIGTALQIAGVALIIIIIILIRNFRLNKVIVEKKNYQALLLRAKDDLEVRVKERTVELFSINERLSNEIEEKKKSEKELHNYKQRLEEIVHERTEQLEEKTNELELANLHLKELDQLKSMFIATMSHELRTPLNSIIGFTGVILKGMSGNLNTKQQDQLNRVYSSAKHLLNLITDIIDISKIEAGRIDIVPESFLLSGLIDEILAITEPLAAKKALGMSVTGNPDITLYTDRRRLMQCLLNFVNNSIKYTETGTITISIKTTKTKVECSVSDTGIGISDKDQKNLFKAFERFDSHLKVKAGGTGLGLYLTKKIVTELLKGTIGFRSAAGQGSTFILTIPIQLSVHKDKNVWSNK